MEKKMELSAKVIITIWIVVIDLFLAYPLFVYHRRKEELQKRYWGKNRKWLENTIYEIIGKIIIITAFGIAVWLV